MDARPENLLAMEGLLEELDINIVKATSGNEALGRVLGDDFALILLDVQMPDMDGFETAELLRSRKKTKQIPIIFITAISKEDRYVFKGYESGAVDYLFKPIDPHILKCKVKIFLDLYNQKRALERTTEEFQQIVKQLEQANEKILQQQKSVIEEERLKVLLQMAGATAHELNQPLMALLGNIELLEMVKDDPEKLADRIVKIQESGDRISSIVKRIISIRHDKTSPHDTKTTIIGLKRNTSILLVEDSDDDYKTINSILINKDKINLSRAKSINEAIQALENEIFDLIFLDYMLPDGNGLDFLTIMKKKGFEIPVVVVTGQGDEMIATRVMQNGAYDYLSKNKISEKSLSRIITNTLEKNRLEQEVNEAMKKIVEMSIKDSLTGIYNRRYFEEAIEREVSRSKRYETDLSLCLMDLDHFKQINDIHGHPAGDLVLSEFGRLLKKWIRHSDQVYRYGGEEFTVLFSEHRC